MCCASHSGGSSYLGQFSKASLCCCVSSWCMWNFWLEWGLYRNLKSCFSSESLWFPHLGLFRACLALALVDTCSFTELRDPFPSFSHFWDSVQRLWPAGVFISDSSCWERRVVLRDYLLVQLPLLISSQLCSWSLPLGSHCTRENKNKKQNGKLPLCKSCFQVLTLFHNLPAFKNLPVAKMCIYLCVGVYVYVYVCIHMHVDTCMCMCV